MEGRFSARDRLFPVTRFNSNKIVIQGGGDETSEIYLHKMLSIENLHGGCDDLFRR